MVAVQRGDMVIVDEVGKQNPRAWLDFLLQGEPAVEQNHRVGAEAVGRAEREDAGQDASAFVEEALILNLL